MLKMTIDNEEVLSNNDISIKEEILSPSSTILNNVYPKEWEEDKDYTSRFYYPKDYSKLNIQNFSVEPEEAGTTIQVNGNATLTDVDTTKESRVLRLLGQTSQVQYTGNQLIDFSNPTSTKLVTTSFTNDVLSVVGSAGSYPNATWDILNLVKNNPGKTLKIKFDNISVTGGVGGIVQLVVTNNGSTSYVGMVNRSGQVATSYNIPSDTSNLTKCDFTIYTSSSGSATAETITMTKPLVYFNNNDTYEPYVGGIASPNPSYPQDINVVSGDNTIDIQGLNLFSPQKAVEDSNNTDTYITEDGEWLRFKTGANRLIYYPIGIKENTKYTLKFTFKSGSNATNGVTLSAFYTDGTNSTFVQYTTTDTNEHTIIGNTTTGKTLSYIRSGYTNGVETFIKIDGLELVEGNYSLSNIPTYEPYIGNSYPLYLGVENLCKPITTATKSGITMTNNGDGSYTLNGTATANTSFYNATLGLEIDTYTFSANNPVASSNGGFYFQVEYQGGGVTAQTFNDVNAKKTFTTTKKIIAWVVVVPNGITLNNFVIKPQLEKGSKANSFTPYGTTPIELCKIGTYQDYIYKDNGSWYLHKEIGKIVLDGSQNYAYSNAFGAILYTDSSVANVDKNTTTILSNKAKGIPVYNLSQNNGIAQNDTANRFLIKFDGVSSYNTNELIKQYFTSNNYIVYYILANPTTTEITDTTLIEQLEALSS